jgi:hypothetical protein
MDLEQALRGWTEAQGTRQRESRLRAAQRALVNRCFATLGSEPQSASSVGTAIRLAAQAPRRPAQRDCAVLIVHALAVPGLIPREAFAEVCKLIEIALPNVLLRCGYPFAGSTADKVAVLERLHRDIDELMQPLEPTFPNWQGLYAG